MLMITPATKPPRITRVQLIFPMATSSDGNLNLVRFYTSCPASERACSHLLQCCRGLKSVSLSSLFLGSANLLFGLEPVIEFRAGLIASLNVEFIGSSSDSLFERKRLNRGHSCACGFWHGDYLRRLRYQFFCTNGMAGRYGKFGASGRGFRPPMPRIVQTMEVPENGDLGVGFGGVVRISTPAAPMQWA